MGEAKRKQMGKKAFLALPENQRCVYCGSAESLTVDHFPPRDFFLKRQFPEGYMYPACSACNTGKSSDEQALGFLVSMLDWEVDGENSEFRRHLRAARNNHPQLLHELEALSPTRSKRFLRQALGGSDAVWANGMNGWQAVEFGPEAMRLLNKMCVWFGQTLYFKHNHQVFSGEVFANRLPHAAIREEKFHGIISRLSGIPEIKQTGHNISNQFFYRYYAVDGGFYGILQFNKPQIFFVICAMTNEHIPKNLSLDNGWFRSGPVGPQ
ncbi:hypothetical protein [Acetobacter persici]|uniref:hypothetical protein n=1 Tax=Acetobacter persici TaxID=1076596 RepID=UPI0039EA7168